jgi:hypothetical protein
MTAALCYNIAHIHYALFQFMEAKYILGRLGELIKWMVAFDQHRQIPEKDFELLNACVLFVGIDDNRFGPAAL